MELHGTLRVGLTGKIIRELDSIFNETFSKGIVRMWMNGSTQISMLSKENDIVYVFVHFLNHFYKGGIGLRQICDWCRLLWSYRDNLDLELLEARIHRMGLMTEWRAFAFFAVNWLGMPLEAMPLFDDNDSLNDNFRKKADAIMEFVMEVGNFGQNRDMSYYSKYPFVVRKAVSAWRRVKDLFRHARIFPANFMRFFFGIMRNGVVSAARGK